MANYNIQMNMLNSSGTYDIFYPQTIGSQVSGAVANATNANYATSSGSASTLSSTLSVSKGGTGVTSYSSLASQLQGYLDSGMTESEVETLINNKTITCNRIDRVLTTSYIWMPMETSMGLVELGFIIISGGGDITLKTNNIEQKIGLASSIIFIGNGAKKYYLVNSSNNFYINNNSQIKLTTGNSTTFSFAYGPK